MLALKNFAVEFHDGKETLPVAPHFSDTAGFRPAHLLKRS